MDVIANGNCVQHLKCLLEFLAAWEKRPVCLTPMAYQWCSALSKMIREPRQDWTYPRQVYPDDIFMMMFKDRLHEVQLNEAGPGCDLDHCSRIHQRDLGPYYYVDCLFRALEIGFRLAWPAEQTINLDHTPYHDRIFEIALSSCNDEVISDAMCARIAASYCTPAGSFMDLFANHVDRTTPFSPRLRQVAILAIRRTWINGLTVSAPETVRLLNRLEVDVGDVIDVGDTASIDMGERARWVSLLAGVIRSPTGFESLSSHNWHLLGELIRIGQYILEPLPSVLRDIEVARSLEEAEDWEKLEVWLANVWGSLPARNVTTPELVESIEQVTLRLCLRRPSALQRFGDQCEMTMACGSHVVELREICNQARVERFPSEPSPLPYVSVPHTYCLSLLMPLFPSANPFTPRASRQFSCLFWEMIPSEGVYHRRHHGLMHIGSEWVVYHFNGDDVSETGPSGHIHLKFYFTWLVGCTNSLAGEPFVLRAIAA